MNIFTFYEPVPGIASEAEFKLLSLWRRNWSAQGWTPFVLNERHAQGHLLYPEFVAAVMKFPTVNPKQYEYLCFIRWLAFAQCSNGEDIVMSDYDVMSYGFKPSNLGIDKLVFYQGHVPALVSGNRLAINELCQMFMEYQMQTDDTYEGKPHTSDMHIIQKLISKHPGQFILDEQMKNYGEDGWSSLPAVHYSHFGTQGMGPRWEIIPKLRQPFPGAA